MDLKHPSKTSVSLSTPIQNTEKKFRNNLKIVCDY